MHIFNFHLNNLEWGPKYPPNLIKVGVHAYLSNGYLNLLSNFNYVNVDKSAYFRPWFNQSWTRPKIAPNLIKTGVHAYLSNGYLNPHSNFNSEKVKKTAYFQPWLDQPWMREKSSKSHKNRCPCLSLKWVPKSTFKTQLWESRKKCIS